MPKTASESDVGSGTGVVLNVRLSIAKPIGVTPSDTKPCSVTDVKAVVDAKLKRPV